MYTSLFTVAPDKENADTLSGLVGEIICQKLGSIIIQIGEQINTDFAHEVEKFHNHMNGFINPALFHYYFKLKDAIASCELTEILDVISLIAHQPVTLSRRENNLPNISSVIDSEWEKELFNKTTRKDPVSEFGMENNFELVRPIFNKTLLIQSAYIKSALEILNQIDAIHSYAALNHLYAIKLFDGTIRGFSYQSAYGNIYIKTPESTDIPVAYYLEHIVHECAHQHLFALQLLDTIILNDKNELFNAPIRKQKRPMDGVFHACFVLARMVRCFRNAGNLLGSSNNELFLNKIDTWFSKSYETVKEHAKLTENGKRIFNSFKPYAYE